MNDELRQLLDASGMTKAAVAKAAKLKFTTVQSFWSGVNGANLATAEKLARAIGYELRFVKTGK